MCSSSVQRPDVPLLVWMPAALFGVDVDADASVAAEDMEAPELRRFLGVVGVGVDVGVCLLVRPML